MGKTAAIVRLLKRAKSGAGAPSEEGNEPGSEDEVTAFAEPPIDATSEGPRVAPDLDASGEGDDDFDLEAGIASIFATIRSGGGDEPREEMPEDTGVTYALLSRLNQLWLEPGHGDA